MSSRSSPFRRRALEQGDVREALDERVRVVGISRWIALGIGILVILGFVAWSRSSEIEDTIAVQGVISSNDGVPLIASPVAGTVIKAPPPGGSVIRAGEVVATVTDGRGSPVAVRAITGGRIETVLTAPGAFVSAGQELALIVPADARPVGFVFVPAVGASKLRVGMETLLSPQDNESRAAGLLRGRIAHITALPATPQRLALLLGPVLASELESEPPVQEVEIALTRDQSTPSGFAWTAGPGLQRVRVGTLVNGRIEISHQSPLSYAF